MATGVGSGGLALAAEAGDKLGECLLEAAALYDKRKVPVLLCEALLRYARHVSSPNLRAGPPGAAAGDGGARAGAARGGGWSSKEVCAVLAKVEVLSTARDCKGLLKDVFKRLPVPDDLLCNPILPPEWGYLPREASSPRTRRASLTHSSLFFGILNAR